MLYQRSIEQETKYKDQGYWFKLDKRDQSYLVFDKLFPIYHRRWMFRDEAKDYSQHK